MNATVDKLCCDLQSLDRQIRQSALKILLKLSEDDAVDAISIYDQTYLYILKCYSDKYESVRELCCTVVSSFLERLPKNDYYLQQVVTTLASRIGQKEQLEPSEEIRLLLLNQLHYLIEKFHFSEIGGDLLLQSYNEIVDILIKELKDSYPAAQKEACICVNILSTATPSFHYRAEAVVNPLVNILNHKHSSNRISAIDALGFVVLHITSNSECIIRIITEISPLLMDTAPLVRKQCGIVGCRMLLELRDRYSFFDRILPLVLCCLNDESPEIRHDIGKIWMKCGKQFYDENEEEINKFELIDDKPNYYPENVNRPTLGCRFIMKRGLRMVKLILREITDWKEEVRLHSLKLLWQVVLHAENDISPMFNEIFPVLSKACADTEKIVARKALSVAELIGILVDYGSWFEFALEELNKNPKIGYLKCFVTIYTSWNANNLSSPDIQRVAYTIAQKQFCHSLKPDFQEYLLKLSSVLVDEYIKSNTEIISAMGNLSISEESNEANIEELFYQIIIKIAALSYDYPDKNIHEKSLNILKKLADHENCTINDFNLKHMSSVLNSFDCLDAEIGQDSEPILLLYGIICICGLQEVYLEDLKKCILTVWEHALPDGKIKVLTGISVALLNSNRIFKTSFDKKQLLLSDFVNDIIIPHLKWKPGACAESMRALATAALCSLAQGFPEEAPIIFGNIVEHFQGLFDDNTVAIRLYALKCLFGFPALKISHIQPLAYAVLQRLDDPSAEVRECAARALVCLQLEQLENQDQSVWENFVKHALSMLLLHLDGPELKLVSHIKNAIIHFGKQYPIFLNNVMEETYNNCSNKEDMDDIKTILLK